jgi:hypothetical protein
MKKREIHVKIIHIATEQLGYNGTVDSFVGMDSDSIDSRFFTILDLYEKALLAGTHKIVMEGRDKPAENFYGDEGFL